MFSKAVDANCNEERREGAESQAENEASLEYCRTDCSGDGGDRRNFKTHKNKLTKNNSRSRVSRSKTQEGRERDGWKHPGTYNPSWARNPKGGPGPVSWSAWTMTEARLRVPQTDSTQPVRIRHLESVAEPGRWPRKRRDTLGPFPPGIPVMSQRSLAERAAEPQAGARRRCPCLRAAGRR